MAASLKGRLCVTSVDFSSGFNWSAPSRVAEEIAATAKSVSLCHRPNRQGRGQVAGLEVESTLALVLVDKKPISR
jgi:hypothetical protein